MRVRGLLLLVLLALTAAALEGCAGRSGSAPGGVGAGGSISAGTGGAIGLHCTTALCVAPVSSHLVWAVEIDPSGPSNSATEELPSIDLYGAGKQLSLTAAASTTVGATFTAPTNGSVPSSANVVLTIPSLIPGRPPLTFQGPTSYSSTGMSTATLTVPMDRLGQHDDAEPRPAAAGRSTERPAFVFGPIGGRSADPPSGRRRHHPRNTDGGDRILLPAIFVARAFQGGTQVSNAPPTQTNGAFGLLLPSATATAAVPLTIQLTPQSSQMDPWFISTPLSPPLPSLSITLPAYITVNQFNLAVESADDPTVKVSGAVVRAQTILGTSTVGTTGTTVFARGGTTDANGVASLSLLPGSGNAALSYSVTVTPPANSPYASQCAGPFDVKAGGSTVNSPSAPMLTSTPIMLTTRPVLTGTVTDGYGYQVANVSVTAKPGPVASGACAAASTSPSSTTTDANGAFTLPLDPGTYQLDYDPPSGSSAPRFTEPVPFVVDVSDTGQLVHDVALPRGGLVQGTAFVSDGAQPLSSATIRIFEPRCSGAGCTTPPWLRGQTVTDGNGQFQIVVPLPQ